MCKTDSQKLPDLSAMRFRIYGKVSPRNPLQNASYVHIVQTSYLTSSLHTLCTFTCQQFKTTKKSPSPFPKFFNRRICLQNKYFGSLCQKHFRSDMINIARHFHFAFLWLEGFTNAFWLLVHLHNTMLSPGLTKDNMYKALKNSPQQKLKTN